MASTMVGIVKAADGTIKQVINPTTDVSLDMVVLGTGETLQKITRTQYQSFNSMKALATALGLKT